jgi:mono/diheme cytochrome c family protein
MSRNSRSFRLSALLSLVALAGPALAAGEAPAGDIEKGRVLAESECAACHRVTAARPIPLYKDLAPAFVDVANMGSTTPTSLYVFLHTSHPTMPNIVLSKEESRDVIAYILSLRSLR